MAPPKPGPNQSTELTVRRIATTWRSTLEYCRKNCCKQENDQRVGCNCQPHAQGVHGKGHRETDTEDEGKIWSVNKRRCEVPTFVICRRSIMLNGCPDVTLVSPIVSNCSSAADASSSDTFVKLVFELVLLTSMLVASLLSGYRLVKRRRRVVANV